MANIIYIFIKFFSMRVKIFYILIVIIGLYSCKKPQVKGNAFLEQYFEANIINRDFVITLANDKGTDITAKYKGYVFVLLKTDMYHGPLSVSLNTSKYTGSWSSNDDYSKLTIVLPDSPAEFNFLRRDWRFTSKSLPTLKFAPWGTTEAVALNMTQK